MQARINLAYQPLQPSQLIFFISCLVLKLKCLDVVELTLLYFSYLSAEFLF